MHFFDALEPKTMHVMIAFGGLGELPDRIAVPGRCHLASLEIKLNFNGCATQNQT